MLLLLTLLLLLTFSCSLPCSYSFPLPLPPLLPSPQVGLGVCSGLVFTATGTLGLTSLQGTSHCKITAFLVLSIIR